MFGRRKAASKASICTPAPNAVALRLSRASPVIRDSSVMPLTVERVRSRFNGAAGARPPRAGSVARDRGTVGRNRESERAFGLDLPLPPARLGGIARAAVSCYYAWSFSASPDYEGFSTHGEQRPSKEARPAGGRNQQA